MCHFSRQAFFTFHCIIIRLSLTSIPPKVGEAKIFQSSCKLNPSLDQASRECKERAAEGNFALRIPLNAALKRRP